MATRPSVRSRRGWTNRRPAPPEPCLMTIDLRDIQGVVTHLYKRPIARHLIFRFDDRAGGRAFIRELAPVITMADVEADTAPDPLRAIGVTFGGLSALGVDPMLLRKLDAIYKAGPDAGPLGDVPGSRSDPARWWEGGFRTEDVHCVVHEYVRSSDTAQAATEWTRSLAARCGVRELIPHRDGTVLEARSLGSSKLHFGYTDGISHPTIEWDDGPDAPGQVNFRTFLLGYSTPEHSSAP